METENREQVNKSPREIMNHIDSILNEYEKSIGLKFKDPLESERYLNLTQQEMRALTLEECAEASLLLAQLSAFVQSEQNKEAARIKMAEQKLERAYLNDEAFTGSWESKRIKAILNDDVLKKWNDIKRYAELRELRLRNISLNIKNLSDQYKNLQYAKVKKNG